MTRTVVAADLIPGDWIRCPVQVGGPPDAMVVQVSLEAEGESLWVEVAHPHWHKVVLRPFHPVEVVS